MALRVTFFDVGHGDSIVIENLSEPRTFAVLDCNINLSRGENRPRAFAYLQANGAKCLDALIVSHLHKDHYTGIECFLDNFEVSRLLIPPILSTNDRGHNELLRKHIRSAKAHASRTSEPEITRPARSLIKLLAYIIQNSGKVEETRGRANQLSLCGFRATVHLPLPRMKSVIQQRLQKEATLLRTFPGMNDASIALTVEYAGKRVLLAADSTVTEWDEHKRQLARDHVHSLEATVLKVPHHGSKHNNKEELYSYLLGNGQSRVKSIVSANGTSHPHPEYFTLVRYCNLDPYCTGLAESCKPQNVVRLSGSSSLPREARMFVDNYEVEGPSVACQGDITLEVSDSGDIHVQTETQTPCVYRMPVAPHS